jgi:hypothetical protein
VRRHLVAALPSRPQWCIRCGGPILPGQAVDLDHVVPRMAGGQGPRMLSHSSCNRSHGARIGNAARKARQQARIRRMRMGRTALGAEIAADRSATFLVLASIPEPGVADIELLAPVDGTDAVAAIMTLWESFGLEAVVVDAKSNAATLVDPLRRAGMPLRTPDASDMAAAHGQFADLMTAGKLRHHDQPRLTAAVRFAQQRRLAGAAAIQRYGGQVDPAPAVAAELAVWALGDLTQLEAEPGAWLV